MKKYILLVFVSILSLGLFAQTFECRVTTGDEGYLYYEIKQLTGTTHPDATHFIGNITVTVSWPYANSTVDARLICSGTSSDYFIEEEGAGKRSDGGNTIFYRKDANYTSNNFTPPTTWVNGTWYTIAKFEITDPGSGTENFSVYTGDGHNFSFDADASGTIEPGENYFPTIATGEGTVTSYPFPTVVYDYVWVGGGSPGFGTDGKSWANPANWETECGGVIASAPNSSNHCFIPSGLTNYPDNTYTQSGGFGGAANNVRIASGAIVDMGNALINNQELTVNGDLLVYGNLNIKNDGAVTANGNTYIDAAAGLVVEAAPTGVGSFIDNGTITYGTTAPGTAKVQTYVHNGNIDNSFYFHTMGPTLDDENFSGAGTGADLSVFASPTPGNTFAYSWSESGGGGSGAWVNQSSNTYAVVTTDGIGISTNDNSSYTMDMVGALMTGTIPSYLLGHGNSNIELISNPYPSSIDFTPFQITNTAVIANKNWIWNPAVGNYIPNAAGTPPEQYIQVGQGFFVQTLQAGVINFMNTHRVHSNTPFRDVPTNLLGLNISGGDQGYEDNLYIRFEEGATTGYDDAIEAIKWNSMYANATQIRSIAEDGTELSINVMPQLDLQGEMVSVPVHFECGYEGEYNFTASYLESFEYGTEIWIEDRQDGNAWHHFSPGHDTYTFTAGPDDAHDRFIIHFFGPTAVDEFTAKNVLIYADNEYALIRNMTKNEVIESVYIYSLAGNTILHKQVPEQNIYRFFVSNHDGYYIVRVVTDKNIYTEKVFIH